MSSARPIRYAIYTRQSVERPAEFSSCEGQFDGQQGDEAMSRRSIRSTDDTKVVRCAVYTRKSTEEGLEQEFNSLDAQRESAEAFIASQRNEGWTCLQDRYDDGGFSGGNMDRPALQRLMADIEVGKVDCVVVYKVDRLSRSLMDFARMMQGFDAKGVSFVSVTQQFNTTHSMGRHWRNCTAPAMKSTNRRGIDWTDFNALIQSLICSTAGSATGERAR